MSTINVKLYDILRSDFSLPEERAKVFAEVIQDIAATEAKGESQTFKSELREDMLRVEMNLKSEIKDSKIDTIKWIVGIFITLAIMIIGLYIKK